MQKVVTGKIMLRVATEMGRPNILRTGMGKRTRGRDYGKLCSHRRAGRWSATILLSSSI